MSRPAPHVGGRQSLPYRRSVPSRCLCPVPTSIRPGRRSHTKQTLPSKSDFFVPWCLCGENVPGLVRLAVTECVRTGPFLTGPVPRSRVRTEPVEGKFAGILSMKQRVPSRVPPRLPPSPFRSGPGPIPSRNLVRSQNVSGPDFNSPSSKRTSIASAVDDASATSPHGAHARHSARTPAVGAQSRFFHSATKLRFVQDQFSTRRARPSKDAHASKGCLPSEDLPGVPRLSLLNRALNSSAAAVSSRKEHG